MKTNNVRLNNKDRLNLFTDLSTMMSAGIPILEAVDSLLADAKGNIRKVLVEIRRSLINGEPLTTTLEHMPQAFDPITVNLIRAAEVSGTLEETMQDITRTIKQEIAFSDGLKNTMIYPAFVMVIFAAIVLLMLTFVIPRVAKVFANLHVNMPITTRIMLKSSAYFMTHWLFVMSMVAAFIFLVCVLIATQKRAIVRGLLSMPGLKVLGRNIDLTRFTRSFALLLRAGIPLDEALMLSQRVVTKKQMITVIEQMRANTEAGKGLSESLRSAKKTIPPMMARSIETAEKAGTLEATMGRLAEHYDNQVAESLKIISSLLEPILIVIVGIMVGTLMITIMAPMYNLISQISPHK